MPIEDFPPCAKRFNSEETDKENTTRALGKEISGAQSRYDGSPQRGASGMRLYHNIIFRVSNLLKAIVSCQVLISTSDEENSESILSIDADTLSSC